MNYTFILTVLLLDILIKARACPPYYPVTSGVPQEITQVPNQGCRSYSSRPVAVVIKPDYPGQIIHRDQSPIERRKLISSVLTLPGMLADKLISGEISV